MARNSVPIPPPASDPDNGRRRKGSVVKSSLDMVFSYSKSQNRFFAGLPSAPSFVDYQWGDGESDGGDAGDDRMREWDPESGPSGHAACESCDEAGESDAPDTESTADTSAFFEDDLERRGPLSPVIERDEATCPLATTLPSKRGGIINYFSTTPTGPGAALSTSVTSGGSDTPRALPRVLPDEPSLVRPYVNKREANVGNGNDKAASERTPLLRTGRPPTAIQRSWKPDTLSPSPHRRRGVSPNGVTSGHRRFSNISARRMSVAHPPGDGDSSNGQTLFNSIAVLIGVGLLSMPLAFSYAGWIGGTIMLLGFSYLTCHTGKLLAHIVIADGSLFGYTDIGRKAFGSWVGGVINMLFCVELFAFGTAMIVLFGDSVAVVFPQRSPEFFMALSFFLVVPTVFMPLKLLSVPSVFSTLATFLLVGIIVIDGFWKTKAPGSILDPMPTHLGPELKGANWLGGIGLILAGFGGHGVMPSIARDMKHPEAVDRIFNIAFTVAAAISLVAGGAGYLMIGNSVSDEITRDLMEPKYGYPRWLNLIAIWMIIITPLTKFGLCSRPLHIAIEGYLNLAPAPEVITRVAPPPARQRAMSVSQAIGSAISTRLTDIATSDYAITDDSNIEMPKTPMVPHEVDTVRESSKGVLRMVSRTVLTAGCVFAAIVLPGFEKVMAFLGSFSAFLICIILPIIFWLRLGPRITKEHDGAAAAVASRLQFIFHLVILVVSVILMCLGTYWAFHPNSGREPGEGRP